MVYDTEMRLLCDTCMKLHISATVVTPGDRTERVFGLGLSDVFDKAHPAEETFQRLLGSLSERTVYRFTDAFRLSYTYFLLPTEGRTEIFFLGPYLSQPITATESLEIGEKNGVSPKSQRYLDEYYAGIPVLPEGSQIFLLLDTFCEHIFESPSFSIVDNRESNTAAPSPFQDSSRTETAEDVLISMKALEKRYQFENELMAAVSLGQLHKESMLLGAFTEQTFEKRLSDPVRNAKNYGIIMNTLLRKAAENGGVHPIYIDRTSSLLAHRIESLSTTGQFLDLMKDIFRSYCRLVRKHSTKNYSPLVQKTILVISSDLSADLSLATLAAGQKVSGGYLSTVFRKETGKTLSSYVRSARIHHAAHLLATTHLQIQTVALHCGIMDVQYFSKIFHKEMGKTPKEYRAAMRQQAKT